MLNVERNSLKCVCVRAFVMMEAFSFKWESCFVLRGSELFSLFYVQWDHLSHKNDTYMHSRTIHIIWLRVGFCATVRARRIHNK